VRDILFDTVRRTIDRYGLLVKGDQVITGVSAGVDSMVLLHLLNRLRQDFSLSLIIAHLNHGLRPEESEREVELIQKESLRLGLPFEYRQYNVKEFQKMSGSSLQDAARKLRFQFFHELLEKHGGGKIALAHHADDQVETVLLGLFRGSGVRGLKGMLPIREGKVIRPLLEVWREEIEEYARERSISFCMDSSNLEGDYLRNRVRLNLIPLIEKEYQSGFRRAVLRTSRILREEDDYLEKEAEKAYEGIAQGEEYGIGLRYSSFRSLHPAIQWRVIQKILNRMDGPFNKDEAVWSDAQRIYRRLLQPPANFLLELSQGLLLVKQYDMVFFKKERYKRIPPFEVILSLPGRSYVPEIEKEVVVEEGDRKEYETIDLSPNMAFFDYKCIQLPLRMRNFRPGDRFQPLGMKGTKKLKDFFIDHKIPKFERPKIPLLISGELIMWIVGYRIDERFKVTPETERVLRVEIR